MKRYHIFSTLLFVSVFFLAACGPSAEEIATLTAAAWTPTPQPTPTATTPPTPTPIPYDLTFQVTDLEGNPLADVDVSIAELGADESGTQTTDDLGEARWTNLPGDTASIHVFGQGYTLIDRAETLTRGPNSFTVELERDPFGLLVSDYVTEEQTLLFIEDFQDGKDDFEVLLGDWQVVEDAENPGNWVIQINQQGSEDFAFASLGPDEHYDNFIIEYKFRWLEIAPFTGDEWQSMGFGFWDSFSLGHYAPNNGWLQLIDLSDWSFPLQVQRSFKIGTWYTVRAEVNRPEFRVYLNGRLLSKISDLGEGDLSEEQRYHMYALPHLLGQYDDIVFIKP